MKVGILTFHRTSNDGSVLQNWCMQRLLEALPSQPVVETIDFRDRHREIQEFSRLRRRRFPFFQASAVRKMIGLRRFLRENISLSKSINTSTLDTGRQFIQRQGYGAVVSGSDTVWQISKIGDTQPPHIYFQPGFQSGQKVAFAVSSDPIADISLFDDPQRLEALAKAVDAFDFIGVRDEPTRRMVERLGIDATRIHFTPDPTVYVDFEELVERPVQVADERPIAGVALGSRKASHMVSEILLDRGWRVVNHLGVAASGAETPPGRESLGQRLGRFATQKLMITDRFHSSIFTLKLGSAPVIFVEDTQKWPEPNSKGRDLFERLGCGDFVWRIGSNPQKEFAELYDAAEAWRSDPRDMMTRFEALRESGKPALDALSRLI